MFPTKCKLCLYFGLLIQMEKCLNLIINTGLLVCSENDVDGLCGLDGHGRLLDDDFIAHVDGLGNVASSTLNVLQIWGFAIAWKTEEVISSGSLHFWVFESDLPSHL